MSAYHGEVLSQSLPTSISVTGSVSGSFTITPNDTPDDLKGNLSASSVSRIDSKTTVRYDHKAKTVIINGIATVTITPTAGTVVAYSMSSRNPTFKSVTDTARTEKYRCHQGLLYSAPFTIPYARPGKHHSAVIRIRAWKLVNGKPSMNEKSKLLILKFTINPDQVAFGKFPND